MNRPPGQPGGDPADEPDRKPIGVPWESWVERRIRLAQEDGAFDDLAAAGKPLPDIDRPYDPLWWVKQWLEREKVSVLPPDLALRKRLEQELAAIPQLRHEAEVRRAVEALNAEIDRTNATSAATATGGLFRLDVEEIVAAWRRAGQLIGARSAHPWREHMSLDEKLAQKFKCSKCNQRGALVKRFAATGTGFSKLIDLQHNKFVAVSCKHCGFTEIYNPDILEGRSQTGNILDLLFER